MLSELDVPYLRNLWKGTANLPQNLCDRILSLPTNARMPSLPTVEIAHTVRGVWPGVKPALGRVQVPLVRAGTHLRHLHRLLQER